LNRGKNDSSRWGALWEKVGRAIRLSASICCKNRVMDRKKETRKWGRKAEPVTHTRKKRKGCCDAEGCG